MSPGCGISGPRFCWFVSPFAKLPGGVNCGFGRPARALAARARPAAHRAKLIQPCLCAHAYAAVYIYFLGPGAGPAGQPAAVLRGQRPGPARAWRCRAGRRAAAVGVMGRLAYVPSCTIMPHASRYLINYLMCRARCCMLVAHTGTLAHTHMHTVAVLLILFYHLLSGSTSVLCALP